MGGGGVNVVLMGVGESCPVISGRLRDGVVRAGIRGHWLQPTEMRFSYIASFVRHCIVAHAGPL